MTKKDIEKLAKDLAKAVMKAAANNPNLSYNEILHKYLQPYNDEVQKQLLEDISKTMSSAIPLGTMSVGAVPMAVPELSSRLYKNAQKTAKAASKILNEYNATKSTIAEMREVLYDGYGYDEMLPFKKDAPGFIQKVITPEKVARLKTKSLKAAYMDALDAKTDKAYAKALYRVVEEKSRYYALRLAMSEEHQAYSIANAAQMKYDGVKYVQWTLSPSHVRPCVCDLWATVNNGMGAGVFELDKAPVPVLSTHAFCQCRLVPISPGRMRYSSNPIKTALDKFPAKDKISVARSYKHSRGYHPMGDFLN